MDKPRYPILIPRVGAAGAFFNQEVHNTRQPLTGEAPEAARLLLLEVDR